MRDIGKVEELQFHLYRGRTLAFDVLWWHDFDKTLPANIIDCGGQITDGDAKDAGVLLEVNTSFIGNRVVVRIDPEDSIDLEPSTAYMRIWAKTPTETRVMARGRVLIYTGTVEDA